MHALVTYMILGRCREIGVPNHATGQELEFLLWFLLWLLFWSFHWKLPFHFCDVLLG
jgi:hypothetical protein